MQNFLLGWAIMATIIAIIALYLLSKKETTVNEIGRQKQVSKRNRGSNSQQEITPIIHSNTKPRRNRLRIFKRKNKKL